jgi:hypothetical protein
MSSENYEEEIEQARRYEDQMEADRRKEEVGMAETGTDEYDSNARYILEAYTQPNEETRGKLGR